MNTESLPAFPYHPDPVATGSVRASARACGCCGRARGWIYEGPVFAEEELRGGLCPFCIADGSAAERFDATFTDEEGVGGHGSWEAVPDAVVEAVSRRTPGFSGWQEEKWATCCGDACEYLGPAGREELLGGWADALAEVRAESGLDGEDWDAWFEAMDREGSPTAYVFRCRSCGRLRAYSDCH